MSCKRKLSNDELPDKFLCNQKPEETEQDIIKLNDDPICNDTEAAILFLKNLLVTNNKTHLFPPVVFVHQIFDIIENKSTVIRQIEILRNDRKIVLIHMGTDENMKIVIFYNDLKEYLLKDKNKSEMIMFQKFFDKVLAKTTDLGVSKVDLLIKYRFSEMDIRTLVNSGLIILKETGIFWFSFPSAGIYMKRMLKGRQVILQIIRKRKYREILLNELKKKKLEKTLDLPLDYLIHDLIGGNFLKCLKTTSGRLLRCVN